MATNPHSPTMEAQRPQLVPPAQRKPRRHWGRIVLLMLVLVAAVVVGTIFYLRRQSPAAPIAGSNVQVPVLPDNHDLQISGVQLNRDPAGTGLNIIANITNNGNHSVSGATVTVTFRDNQGRAVETVDRPILGIAGGNCELTKEFVRHPIKPNALRFFCVTVNPVPAAWNREPPEIQVLSAVGQ